MKSQLRANRLSGGTHEKIKRIIKDVSRLPADILPAVSSGAKIFAVWRNYPRRGSGGRTDNGRP